MIDTKIILEIAEEYESLKPIGPDDNPDFYDSCILGITDNGNLVYGKELMITFFAEYEELSYSLALEYLDYNCFSAYVGEMTPLYINQYI